MRVKIRKAVAEDYESACSLFDELDTLHREHLPNIFRQPSDSIRERDYFIGLVQDGDVGVFVAEAEGALVGFVHAIVKDTPAIPVFVSRRYVVVDSIEVKPRHRAKAIGRLLTDTAQEWANAKGATAIELNVYEFNQQAIDFYAALGYATLSRKMSKLLDAG